MTKLNPGIVRLVEVLNKAGFATCDSGDGETHDFDCDRSDPYVVVQLAPGADLRGEAQRCMWLLKAKLLPESFENKLHIQANYSPADDLSFLDISGIKDRDLDSAED